MQENDYQRRKKRSIDMLNSGIEPIQNANFEYYISSQTDIKKKYKVTIKNKWYSCECPDNKEGHLCKHILLLKCWLAMKYQRQNLKNSIDISTLCPSCSSTRIIKDGTRKTQLGKKQRYRCIGCNTRFVNDPINNIKGNLEVVTIAIDLYMRGVSYRGIRDHIKQFFGLKVNHVTIMRWIQENMDKINSYVDKLHPEVSDKWHADEQMVNIKGKHKYLWNCMDNETRFLLSNKVSPTRTTKDARELFQKAKKIANKKAKKIVTDGAFAYEKSVNKEFRTYQNMKPHDRYVSLKQKTGNNNIIERYHGSFRQRDKSMRAFKTIKGTTKYSEGFRTFYNFIREHQGLDGKTPAQAGKLNVPTNWKELLSKAIKN